MTGEAGKFYFASSIIDTNTFFTCGFASPANGQIMKYNSGVETVKHDVFGYIFNGIKINDTLGIAIAYDSAGVEGNITRRIYRSSDSGETWTQIFEETSQQFYFHRVMILSDTMAYVIGDDSLYKTIDGGLNWLPVSIEPQQPLKDFAFRERISGSEPIEPNNIDLDVDVRIEVEEA